MPNISLPGPRPCTVGSSTSTSKIFSSLAACCLAVVGLAPGAAAQNNYKLTTLHRFVGGAGDGALPNGDLVKGADGRFYGTTNQGGSANGGTVFAMTPAGALTTLYAFTAQDSHGANPTPNLVEGADGRLYGTTYGGGNSASDGTVFAITPAGALTTLHNFAYSTTNGTDGGNPIYGLVRGMDGLFYGTTRYGNAYRDGGTHGGFVFSITPQGTVTYLHNFFQSPDGDLGKSEGTNPGRLTLGRDGRFYGVNHNLGGSGRSGTVFAVTTGGALTVLHRFLDSSEGDNPNDRLVQGSDGRFYGVTQYGGIDNRGVVFAVDAAGSFTVLHRFSSDDGTGVPMGGLTQGQDGRLYGTTAGYGDPGTVYAITPAGELTILYRFTSSPDGNAPQGALFQDSDGSFYGTTVTGGTNNSAGFSYGTVFRLTPTPPFFNGEVALNNGIYYLSFPNGNIFGYYGYLPDPHYVYHLDLGYEYVIDAADSSHGVYLYDFASNTFWYTSPVLAFPYLYDFSLQAFLYYYPDPNNPGRYNTNGVRYFYNFATGKIITK